MRVAVFSVKPYDQDFLETANTPHGHELHFLELRLSPVTVGLAEGFLAVCCFVNDELGEEVLTELKQGGTQLVALRSAGFNNVDLMTAADLGLRVVHVPAYSPAAVAEHTVGLMLALNRKIHRAYQRVREGNFALQGLLGFDLRGKTVGVIGTGKIGALVAEIMLGFGCELLASDLYPSSELEARGARYVPIDDLLTGSDIITLHTPLTPDTHHLIDAAAIEEMKHGVMLINTSRGALIDTYAVIAALKTGRIGHLGLDVYEEEADLFFQDLSGQVIQDDVFARLLTFPNVIITGHQAFFTEEALRGIAETTLQSISDFEDGRQLTTEVYAEKAVR